MGVYLASAIPLLTGIAWLTAWWTGRAVTWATQGMITVKANMAVAQIAAGTALLLLTSRRPGWRRATGTVLASLVFAIGALTLLETLLGWDLGIDQLLAREPPGAAATFSPNRIGPPGTVTLVVVGLGLAALSWQAQRLTFYAGLVTCLISIVPGIGFLYGASRFYGVPGVSGIAAPTVVTALALGLGLMLAVGGDSPLALLRRNDPGGALLRRTLGLALLIPLLLGLAVVAAERHGLVDPRTGLASFAVIAIVLLAVLLWKSAAGMSQAATARERDERALHESEARFRAAFEGGAIAMALTGLDGKLLKVNPAFSALLGYDEHELEGKPFAELTHPDDLADSMHGLEQVAHGKRPSFRLEKRYRHKDGHTVWGDLSTALVRDAEGRPLYLVAHIQEITARKRVEQEANYRAGELEAVLAAQRDVIIEYDADMNVRRANQAFRADYGFAPEGLNLREIMARVRCRSLDGTPLVLEQQPTPLALRGEKPSGRTYLVTRADGSDAVVESSANPLRAQGQVVGSVTVWHDVTERKRAEEELRTSERRYRELFASMTEGFAVHEVMCDADGAPIDFRFLEINPAFTRLTGLGPEIVGRTHNQVLPDDDPSFVRRYGKVALTGQSIEFENYSPALKRHYQVIAFAVGPGRFATLFMDITERKLAEQRLRDTLAEAEEGRRILCTLMEHVPEGITIAEAPEGTIRMVSRYGNQKLGSDHTGITAENLVRHWTVFEADGRTVMPTEALPLMRAIRNGEIVTNAELVQVSDRGEQLVLLCNAAPIRSAEGTITGGIVAWRDVSDMRRARDALRASEASLREADRRKDEFLGVLSHELRNPLAPIRNSLYVLDRAAPGSAQAKRAQTVIDRQIKHMTRLVDDLLDVTRITRGKIYLQRSRLNLVDLVRHTVEDHASLLADHRLTVDLPGTPVWVDGDATRLAQALGNLIHNAAKFTPKGERVTVSLTAPGDEALLEVVDTGMGIDDGTLTRLFQPFAQADRSLDRSRGGLGLGLALVRGMIELHQGRVAAHSDGPGRGARFTVTLPVDEESSPHAAAGASASTPAHDVLLIEDNRDAAETLAEVLTLAGHRVTVAHDGESGVHQALELGPDVVVCDIGLPGMDGYDVARTLRGAGLAARLVALSGYAQPEDLRRAKEAGFDSHLAKPADLTALLAVLDRGSAPERG